MPRSKKGRLSGAARKEINERRGAEALARLLSPKKSDPAIDFVVGRVTKITGANHVRVAIDSKRGAKELPARIPNMLTRRGATPISTRSIVLLYTGEDYDPNAPAESGEHFDIIALLTDRQANELMKANLMPNWMIVSDADNSGAIGTEVADFEWDYDEKKEDAATASAAAAGGAGFSRGGARAAAAAADSSDDDFDIDEI
jgi:hypothetical protein